MYSYVHEYKQSEKFFSLLDSKVGYFKIFLCNSKSLSIH